MRFKRRRAKQRRGNILVLSAFLMVGMLACVAFSVDLGYLLVANTELQRSADSAALAACLDMVDQDTLSNNSEAVSQAMAATRATAVSYGALNSVCNISPVVDVNADNDPAGGVVLGHYQNAATPVSYANPAQFNSVRVRVRRTAAENGEVPFFFAKALGLTSIAAEAEAMAAFTSEIIGFKAPANGQNLNILPFALDKPSWDALMAGAGPDQWTWDSDTKTISPGSDGVLELNLYPQGTGSPGNRGTVDIGNSNNSTADLSRQILEGVNADDLSYLGGELKLNEQGALILNGDTGISAGIKDELASIVGQPKVLPVFSQVVGPGNNANYTIVQFVGVRIMSVKLTGKMSGKHVTIQPAKIVTPGVITSSSPGAVTSQYVYGPVQLVE